MNISNAKFGLINHTPKKVRSTLEGISWISPLNKRPLWIPVEIPLNSIEFHWFSLDFHEIFIGFDWGNLKDPIGIPLNSIETKIR